ncbi:hypothetical protein OIO90_001477 [Microbotryomycetes sp. JL221]|nr:hypothetical protein OIO90_001477 [Microbotryomycetes sp. JL221]
MANDGAPYAKRQKVTATSHGPNLNPHRPREPVLYQPQTEQTRSHHDHSTRHQPPSSSSSSSSSLRHGNFLGYYNRRRQVGGDEADPRLRLLPKSWFKHKRVLDVGSNTGQLTITLAQTYEPALVIGVDIDERLTKLAHKQVELAWSRQQPLPHLTQAYDRLNDTGQLTELEFKDDTLTQLDTCYFPLSMPRMLGFLPTPHQVLTTFSQPSTAEQDETTNPNTKTKTRKLMPIETKSFPLNIKFKTCDWVHTHEFEPDKRGYHVILALSITKWIHLNGGNESLFQFFTKLFKTLLPGGILILEPQLFSTYSNAIKSNPELKFTFDELKSNKGWKVEQGDFENILLNQIGFERIEKLGETGDKGFKRPVWAFFKRQGSWL